YVAMRQQIIIRFQPFRRGFLKLKSHIAAPPTNFGMLYSDLLSVGEVVGLKYSVVIHEHEQVAFGFCNPAEPRRGRTESHLADVPGIRMPREIDGLGQRDG